MDVILDRFSMHKALTLLSVLAAGALLWVGSSRAATSQAMHKPGAPAVATAASAASQPKGSPYANFNRTRQQAAMPPGASPGNPAQHPPRKVPPRGAKKT